MGRAAYRRLRRRAMLRRMASNPASCNGVNGGDSKMSSTNRSTASEPREPRGSLAAGWRLLRLSSDRSSPLSLTTTLRQREAIAARSERYASRTMCVKKRAGDDRGRVGSVRRVVPRGVVGVRTQREGGSVEAAFG